VDDFELFLIYLNELLSHLTCLSGATQNTTESQDSNNELAERASNNRVISKTLTHTGKELETFEAV
jgi:hypothetical protein